MSDNLLVELSIEFAVKIVKMTDEIQGKAVLKNQILKSGTSIGANVHEANYAQSKADFVSKLQIALKECYETEYWLELFSKTNIIDIKQYSELKNDCGKIRRILISSVNTTKEKYSL
jgi:four helix bundle protein